NCRDYNLRWAQAGHAYADQCIASLAGRYALAPGVAPDPTRYDSRSPEALDRQIQSNLSTYYIEIGIGAAVAAIGGIALVTGIVLVATAPSESDVDRGA